MSGDKLVLMPNRLTADNGAKGLLIGEFFETFVHVCPDCGGDGETIGETCDVCDGTGMVRETVWVSWGTIKDIYAMAVKHLGKEVLA